MGASTPKNGTIPFFRGQNDRIIPFLHPVLNRIIPFSYTQKYGIIPKNLYNELKNSTFAVYKDTNYVRTEIYTDIRELSFA